MKTNSFEIAYLDHNQKEVIINRQKRRKYWKLKILSLLLAFLLWLASTVITQSGQSQQKPETQKPTEEQSV